MKISLSPMALMAALSFILFSCAPVAEEEFPNGQWACGENVITINGDHFWINGTKEDICKRTINVWMTGQKVDVIFSQNDWDHVEGFPKRMFALDREHELLYDIFGLQSFGPQDIDEIPWGDLDVYHRVRRDKIIEFKNEIPKEYFALKGLWRKNDYRVLVSDDGIRSFGLNYNEAKIARIDVLLPSAFTIVKNKTRHESYLVFDNQEYRINNDKSLDGFEKVSDNQVDMALYRAHREALINHEAMGLWHVWGTSSYIEITPNEMKIHLPKYDVKCTLPYILDDEGIFISRVPSEYYNAIAELRPNGKLKLTIEEYCGVVCTLYMTR